MSLLGGLIGDPHHTEGLILRLFDALTACEVAKVELRGGQLAAALVGALESDDAVRATRPLVQFVALGGSRGLDDLHEVYDILEAVKVSLSGTRSHELFLLFLLEGNCLRRVLGYSPAIVKSNRVPVSRGSKASLRARRVASYGNALFIVEEVEAVIHVDLDDGYFQRDTL